MQLQSVNSSQINAIGYAAATNTMRIEFKSGSLYEYANVPPDLFEQFAKAPSTGSFFYKHIKPFPDKYPYVKLEDNKAIETTEEMRKGSESASIPTAVDGGTADAVYHPTDPEQPVDPVPPPPGG